MLFDRVPLFRYAAMFDDGRFTPEFYALLIFMLLFTFVGVYLGRRDDPGNHDILGFGLFCAIASYVVGFAILSLPGIILLFAMFVFVISLAAWLGGKGGSND